MRRFICIAALWAIVIFSYGQDHYNSSLIELPKVTSRPSEIIVSHIGYTASYNTDWKIPNWVAYKLSFLETLGETPRKKVKFMPDPLIDESLLPTHEDYTNSGYSRGHMAPAADMKWSEQAMLESFYLTNVCPQNPSMNSGVWNRIEQHVRTMIEKWGDVYICCGPIVERQHNTIGVKKVAVPSHFYKVLCRKDKKTHNWMSIGFIIPNEPQLHKSMFDFACSVDEVESKTGIDFFHNLPDNIENYIEKDFSIKYW